LTYCSKHTRALTFENLVHGSNLQKQAKPFFPFLSALIFVSAPVYTDVSAPASPVYTDVMHRRDIGIYGRRYMGIYGRRDQNTNRGRRDCSARTWFLVRVARRVSGSCA
jgi:hypothetical protein